MANRRAPRWPPGCHALLARAAAHGIGLLAMTWAAAAAPAVDCAADAAALIREESELPRLEVASPADRPPYCITLETIMAFAGRERLTRRAARSRITPRPSPNGTRRGRSTQDCLVCTGASERASAAVANHRANITGFAESPAISRADRRDAPRSPATSSTLPAKLREGLGRTAHRWY